MSTAKWATPSAESSNLAGTALNNLAGAASARIAYDNSANKDFYARVTVVLGSFDPGANKDIKLYRVGVRSAVDEDYTTTLESYAAKVSAGASVKTVIFPMVRIYPFSDAFRLENNTSNNFASSGNAFYVQPYNESIA